MLYILNIQFLLVMGKHLMLHGDGVKDVAFEVEDCIALYKVTGVIVQWS